mmetsp:Transcript_1423/g.3042  ORF Transcript_1423/g.3042 Transcript_1423/m.3042 type:complete len:481 (-) Transcript_1423:9-1451(-)
MNSVATCIGTTAAAAASRLRLRATYSTSRSSLVSSGFAGIATRTAACGTRTNDYDAPTSASGVHQERQRRPIVTTTSTCPRVSMYPCHASSSFYIPVRMYSTSFPTYGSQRRGKFGSRRSEGGRGSRSSGGGGGGGGSMVSRIKKREARRKKKLSASAVSRTVRAEKRRMRGGKARGGGGGKSRGRSSGGKSRGKRSGGGMARLPPGDSDASSVLSSDNNDFQYDFDSDDDDDDIYSYRRDGGRKLYYYQINDIDEPSRSSGWTTDVPPAIRDRMQSDPTFFHGMDGMAAHWTPPPRTPPSEDPRVQKVLRDILQRQEARRRQQARGDDNEDRGWNGRVIIRAPKRKGKSSGSDSGAVGGSKDGGKVSEDMLGTRIDTARSEASTKQAEVSDASASATATAVAGPPKKNRTAYILYSMAKRAEVKKAEPDVSPRDIIKMISEEWRAIGDEEKKIWDEKAAADKMRYSEEMEAYKSGESCQ